MALAAYLIALYYEIPKVARRMIPWAIAFLAFVSCVAAASCGSARAPVHAVSQEPPRDTLRDGVLVPFEPLWWYQRWWGQMEQCSGYQGDFNRIRWFIANKMFLRVSSSPDYYFALTYQKDPDGPIDILFAITEPNDSTVVHHEMLHALRALNGKRDAGGSVHGREDFVEKCGALVGPLPPGSH